MDGSMTLKFEQFMKELYSHPHAIEIIQSIRATMPTWLQDQSDAAIGGTAAILDRISNIDNRKRAAKTDDEIPDWIRLGVLDTWVNYCIGSADTCIHSPVFHRPQPVFAMAWKPGLVVCGQCLHLVKAAGVADKTCDGCGRICAGPEHGDGIYPGAIQFGPMAWHYGACESCHDDQERLSLGSDDKSIPTFGATMFTNDAADPTWHIKNAPHKFDLRLDLEFSNGRRVALVYSTMPSDAECMELMWKLQIAAGDGGFEIYRTDRGRSRMHIPAITYGNN
jgi:hypothetical protein